MKRPRSCWPIFPRNPAPLAASIAFIWASTRNNLAIMLQALDLPEQAEGEYQAAIDLLSKLTVDYPLAVDYSCELAAAFNSLAGLLPREPGRKKETENAYNKSLALLEKLHGEFPPNAAMQ